MPHPLGDYLYFDANTVRIGALIRWKTILLSAEDFPLWDSRDGLKRSEVVLERIDEASLSSVCQ